MDDDIYKKLKEKVTNPTSSVFDCERAFMLLKLCNNPISVLGNDDNPKPGDTESIRYYDCLFLNNDLVQLMWHCLNDLSFMEKATIGALEKIDMILGDSIECKSYYMTTVKSSRDKLYRDYIYGSRCSKWEMKHKYGCYDKDRVLGFDAVVADHLRNVLNNEINSLYKNTVKRKDDKQFVLSLIGEEIYDGTRDDDIYLEMYSIKTGAFSYNEELLESTVLENRFIEIVNRLLDNHFMSKLMIEHALEILLLGIRIKKHQLTRREFDLLNVFTKDEMKEFDVKSAEETLSRLSIEKRRLESSETRNKLQLIKSN